MNKAIIVGRLGKDPEVRFTPSGAAVASFSVATDESYATKDGKKVESTEWHNITAWNKLAELCGEYIKKGSQVLVEGKIKTEKYEKDGVTKYSTKIVAETVKFLDSKGTKTDVGSEKELPF
jgi:single-strand DNA-binding protein